MALLLYRKHHRNSNKTVIEITTIEAYKAWRMVGNLVWGIRDRERTQHGAYPNRGHHARSWKALTQYFLQKERQQKKQTHDNKDTKNSNRGYNQKR